MTVLSIVVGVALLLAEVAIARHRWWGWLLVLLTLPVLVYMNVVLHLFGLLPMNLAVAVNSAVAIRSWRRVDPWGDSYSKRRTRPARRFRYVVGKPSAKALRRADERIERELNRR